MTSSRARRFLACVAIVSLSAAFLGACTGGTRQPRSTAGGAGGTGIVLSPRHVQVYQRTLPSCPYSTVTSFTVDARSDPRQEAINAGAHAIIDFRPQYAVDSQNRRYIESYSGVVIRFTNRNCMR